MPSDRTRPSLAHLLVANHPDMLGTARRLVVLFAAVAASIAVLSISLALAVVAMAFAGPRRSGRSRLRRPEEIVASALGIVNVLFGRPQRGWHPCLQCGVPIEPPSRAEFCSPACRRYDRLRRMATEAKAARLDAFGEVPF